MLQELNEAIRRDVENKRRRDILGPLLRPDDWNTLPRETQNAVIQEHDAKLALPAGTLERVNAETIEVQARAALVARKPEGIVAKVMARVGGWNQGR